MLDPPSQYTTWVVFIEWSGRHAFSPLSATSLQDRYDEWNDTHGHADPSWIDLGDDLNPLSIVVSIIIGLVFIAISPIVTPIFAASATVVVALAEVVIIMIVALIAITVRTLVGRPWQILAVNGHGETWSWKQKGWTAARALASRIQEELDAGASPDRLPPGESSAEGQVARYSPNNSDLRRRLWFRVATKCFAIALTVVAIYRILVAIYG